MKTTLKNLTILLIAIAFILILAGSVNAATPVTDEVSLRTALENGESVILQNEITITSKTTHPSATSRNRAAIAVQANSVTNEVIIDGNGNKISTSTIPTIFEIYGGSTVIFKNITIENTAGGGRVIDTRVNVKLILDNVNLKTTKTISADHDQTLTIGGSFEDEMTVEIKNSKISAGVAGYGIISFNKVNLTITNSEVSGYGALYMKDGSEGSNIKIKNSVMKSELNSDEPSNSFGTIAIEDNNIEIIVEDSKILATGTGSTPQIPFGEDVSITGNKFTVSGNSELVGKGGIFETNTNATITVHSEVTSNLQIPQEYLAQGTIIKEVNGEFVIEEEKTVEDKKEENETLTDDKTNSVEPEKLEKDDTPKMGSNMISVYAIIALVSLVAVVAVKRYNA